MMTTRRLALVGVAVFLLLGVIMLSRKRPSEPFLAEATLSDGVHKYRLLQFSEGPLDYDWKDPTPPLLHGLLRMPHVAFIPIHLSGLTQRDRFPGVSMLFRPVDGQGRYSNGPRGFVNPVIAFRESTGFVFEINPPFNHPDFAAFGEAALTTSALPRRDPVLKILIHENGQKTTKPIEMDFPNPLYRKDIAEWTPEPLPATKSAGDVTVELTGLKLDRHEGVRPECRIKSSDPKWHPSHRSWLEDATGNRGSRLSPFEPAWRVQIAVDPRGDAAFPAEQTWRMGPYKLPKDGEFVELKNSGVVADKQFEGVVLAGKGRVQIKDGILSSQPPQGKSGWGISSSSNASVVQGRTVRSQELESGLPFVWIDHPPLSFETKLVVRVVAGDTIHVGNVGGMTSNWQHSAVVTFPSWPKVEAEGFIEVVLARPLAVDFLVAPPSKFREEMMKPQD
jgi:hypothetical protein